MRIGFLPLALCLCVGLVGGCTGSKNQGPSATPTRTATVAPSPTSAPPTVAPSPTSAPPTVTMP
jgi:hypothetical protein